MANVRDIRRRIRSVKNTRQITKAMKMVSAAKLRRAQERALAARPYALMITNVLRSLVSRTDLVDPKTGEPKHPLLAQRPEQNILLVLVTGDRGLAGAFNSNVLKAAASSWSFSRTRTSASPPWAAKAATTCAGAIPWQPREAPRAPARCRLSGEHLNLLGKLEYEAVSEIVERVIQAYDRAEIDSVYVLYNEFKSVISQRLIAQRILPVQEIGRREVALTEEFTLDERERMGEAARTAGISLKEPEETEAETPRQGGSRRPMWITSTSSRRKRSSATCCRSTSSCSSFRRCWSRWLPSRLPA